MRMSSRGCRGSMTRSFQHPGSWPACKDVGDHQQSQVGAESAAGPVRTVDEKDPVLFLVSLSCSSSCAVAVDEIVDGSEVGVAADTCDEDVLK